MAIILPKTKSLWQKPLILRTILYNVRPVCSVRAQGEAAATRPRDLALCPSASHDIVLDAVVLQLHSYSYKEVSTNYKITKKFQQILLFFLSPQKFRALWKSWVRERLMSHREVKLQQVALENVRLFSRIHVKGLSTCMLVPARPAPAHTAAPVRHAPACSPRRKSASASIVRTIQSSLLFTLRNLWQLPLLIKLRDCPFLLLNRFE